MIPGSVGLPVRKRRCPTCGGIQAVSVLLRDSSVTCRRCGAMIPPTPTTDRPRPKKRK